MSQSTTRWSHTAQVVAFGLAAVLLTSLSAGAGEKPVTLQSLLNDMASRDSIARLPDPAYVCKEASSHDRRKTDPADAKTWHSNQDYAQFLRTETNDGRQEWVIMEHQGPGAISRMWLPLNADRDKQVVRFYLDGSTTPAIAVPFNDLISGHGFVKPPLAFISWDQTDVRHELDEPGRRGVGSDLYLPIPFAKSCKITLDKLPFYYIINYRSYESGTQIQTFSMAGFDAAKATIARAGEALLSDPGAGAPAASKRATLAPGEAIDLDLPAGPAAVQTLQVKLGPGHDAQAIRSTVMTAAFDDEPAVWCPLSEFFGTGVRSGAVKDFFRTVSADGTLTARWVMPYQRSARVGLKNLGKSPVTVSLEATTGDWKWDERSMHFHGSWHCQLGMATRPMFDWNYIDIQGHGSYVGDTLTVYTPVPAWYGEGDERIYIDGEKVPSQIGTGTEDYYGYAWGMAGFFDSPFISMPQRDAGGQDWRGYTTTSRLRSLDAIPFVSGLSHNMEIWNWADTHVDYAVGTFWYARPGASSNREPQPAEAAAPLHEAPPNPRAKHPGAIECETLAVVGHSPGLAFETQDVSSIPSGRWSQGKQLFVRATKAGDYIELQVPVEGTEPRKISLGLTKSRDYGILRMSVNGKTAGPDFDGYNPASVEFGPIDLGTFDPVDGKLVLRVEVVGTNPSSKPPRFYFGLDYLLLTKP